MTVPWCRDERQGIVDIASFLLISLDYMHVWHSSLLGYIALYFIGSIDPTVGCVGLYALFVNRC